MGFLSSLFGGNRGRADDDSNIGDRETYDQTIRACRKVLEQVGWIADGSSPLPMLTDDHGFFRDIWKIMIGDNPLYKSVREMGIGFYVQQTSCTMLWGGIYAVMCAKNAQRSLYLNYKGVWRRFADEGPLPCVMSVLESAKGPIHPEAWDDVFSRIFEQYPAGFTDALLQKAVHDDQVVLAYCKAFYHAGNAIGFYYANG